jgi:hypothetical protein
MIKEITSDMAVSSEGSLEDANQHMSSYPANSKD